MKNQRTFHQNVVCWSMELLKLLFHQKIFFQSSKTTGPRWYQFRCYTKNHSIPPLFFVDYLFWGLNEYKSPLNARKSREIKKSGWTSFFRFLILRSKQIWLLQLIVAGCNEDWSCRCFCARSLWWTPALIHILSGSMRFKSPRIVIKSSSLE